MPSARFGVLALTAVLVASLGNASADDAVIAAGAGEGRHWVVVTFSAAGTVRLDMSWESTDHVGGGVGLYDAQGNLLRRQVGVSWISQGDPTLQLEEGVTSGTSLTLDGPDPFGERPWRAGQFHNNLPSGTYVAVLWMGGWPGSWNYSVTASGGGSATEVTSGTEGTYFVTSQNFTGSPRLQASYAIAESSYARAATFPLRVNHLLIGSDFDNGGVGHLETRLVGEDVNMVCRCWVWDTKGQNAITAGDYAFVLNATEIRHSAGWHFTGLDFAWPITG